MTKASIAVQGGQGAASARIRELAEQLTENVVNALVRRQPSGGTFHIEDVQDQVELSLMRSGEHDVAREYVLYRAKRMEERKAAKAAAGGTPVAAPQIHVVDGGERRALDVNDVHALVNAACSGLEKHVDADAILAETVKNLYDGVSEDDLNTSMVTRHFMPGWFIRIGKDVFGLAVFAVYFYLILLPKLLRATAILIMIPPV